VPLFNTLVLTGYTTASEAFIGEQDITLIDILPDCNDRFYLSFSVIVIRLIVSNFDIRICGVRLENLTDF